MTSTFKKIISILLRLAIAGIFIYASLYKIKSPSAFAHQIYNYKMLNSWFINPMAITLPWLQLLCGVLLLINLWTKEANSLILAMLVVFQIAVASALMRGLNVSCGCFKAGGDPASWLTFGRDSLFLLAVIINQILIAKENGSQRPQ